MHLYINHLTNLMYLKYDSFYINSISILGNVNLFLFVKGNKICH